MVYVSNKLGILNNLLNPTKIIIIYYNFTKFSLNFLYLWSFGLVKQNSPGLVKFKNPPLFIGLYFILFNFFNINMILGWVKIFYFSYRYFLMLCLSL